MAKQEQALFNLARTFQSKFDELHRLDISIHDEIKEHSPEKILKGNERVGWLGEIYGKTLYEGRLVDDSNEHDFEAEADNVQMKVSVKTRKGTNWIFRANNTTYSGQSKATNSAAN